MDDSIASHVSNDVVHRENEKHVALDLSLGESSSPSLSYGGPLHFGVRGFLFLAEHFRVGRVQKTEYG